jgi:Flp pilus assembly protein TadD
LLELQAEVADAVSAALAQGWAADTQNKGPQRRRIMSPPLMPIYAGRNCSTQLDESRPRRTAEFTMPSGWIPPTPPPSRPVQALAVIANQYAQADERRALYDKSVGEARLAIAHAAQYPEGHAALGYALFYGKLDVIAADAPYRKALELAAEAPKCSAFAPCRARRRQFEDAFPPIERAQALDPINASLAKNEGRIRFASGDYEGAIVSARRSLELNPKLGGAHGDIGNALLMLGRSDEASAEFALESVDLLAIPGRALVALRRKDMAAVQRN